MRKKILLLISTGLLLLANINIATASGTLFYQPEVPEVLRK
ncbi:MAG: cyclic lactone autoinducer peptide [Thermincolia bacterium]